MPLRPTVKLVARLVGVILVLASALYWLFLYRPARQFTAVIDDWQYISYKPRSVGALPVQEDPAHRRYIVHDRNLIEMRNADAEQADVLLNGAELRLDVEQSRSAPQVSLSWSIDPGIEPRYRFVNRTPEMMKVTVLQFDNKPDKALTQIFESDNPHDAAKVDKPAFAGQLDQTGSLAISSASFVGAVELISRRGQLEKKTFDVRVPTNTAWMVVLGQHNWWGVPNPFAQTDPLNQSFSIIYQHSTDSKTIELTGDVYALITANDQVVLSDKTRSVTVKNQDGYLVVLFGDVGDVRPVNMVVQTEKLALSCDVCRVAVTGGLEDVFMRGPKGQMKLALESYSVNELDQLEIPETQLVTAWRESTRFEGSVSSLRMNGRELSKSAWDRFPDPVKGSLVGAIIGSIVALYTFKRRDSSKTH